MELRVVPLGDRVLVEGVPQMRLIDTARDVVELIELCFAHQARGVLLYAENLPARFWDLSSGEAGAILQKFRTYRLVLAVVASAGGSLPSTNFGAMLAEERRVGDFDVFSDRDAAVAWLLGTRAA